MKPSRFVSLKRLAVLVVFTVSAFVVIGYAWTETGSSFFGIKKGGEYRVSVELADVDNLVTNSDVQIAGIEVGKVEKVSTHGNRTKTVLRISPEHAPLHHGATIRVGAKSLVGETYLDIDDGSGEELASGTRLPASAVKPSVQLNDVLRSINPRTRDALRDTLGSLGSATKDSRTQIAQVMSGLGKLGRDGHTALDAIAAQSEDLKALAQQTTKVLGALDTGQGEIATLVRNAQTITGATAGQRTQLAATMRALPGVVGSAQTATDRLTGLSRSLAPVAANLREAAPYLTNALRELPSTVRDVRGLLPSLSGALDRAPATLDRTPRFGKDARNLIPITRSALAEINPMLGYIKPYGKDLAAFFANFNAIWSYATPDGTHYLRIQPNLNENSIKTLPFQLNVNPKSNAYPKPGQSANPGPFVGKYPRVERDPN